MARRTMVLEGPVEVQPVVDTGLNSDSDDEVGVGRGSTSGFEEPEFGLHALVLEGRVGIFEEVLSVVEDEQNSDPEEEV